MILSDRQIKAAIEAGDIHIDPFDPKALGTNSYDVHLGPILLTYEQMELAPNPCNCGRPGCDARAWDGLDAKREHKTARIDFRDSRDLGFTLLPSTLYLASTVEYTRTDKYVPFLDGKSSIGRLGITIHCTAGRGDVGFAGHWTMEIHVVQPVRVYAGMPIGQLIYFETGEVDVPYDKKSSAKYNNRSSEPQPSQMWRNFK